MKFPIELRKENARTKIIVDVDQDMSDPWYIRISHQWIKSNKEFNSNTLIKKDVDRYLSMLIREGYKIMRK